MSDAQAPAGWYPVGDGSGQLRYWDGSAWTDHVHDPRAAQAHAAEQGAQGQQGQVFPRPAEQPTAPAGTRTSTIWGWLAAASPVLLLLELIPLYFWLTDLYANFNPRDPATFFAGFFSPMLVLVALLALAGQALYIVFAVLDRRALERNGAPAPFHWAWSFFTLVSYGGLVYMIGRAVVIRRRTGTSAYGPMTLYIVLLVVTLIASFIVSFSAVGSLQQQLTDQFNTSGGIA